MLFRIVNGSQRGPVQSFFWHLLTMRLCGILKWVSSVGLKRITLWDFLTILQDVKQAGNRTVSGKSRLPRVSATRGVDQEEDNSADVRNIWWSRRHWGRWGSSVYVSPGAREFSWTLGSRFCTPGGLFTNFKGHAIIFKGTVIHKVDCGLHSTWHF